MAAELFIYDEIGPSEWGLIDDKSVIAELAGVPDEEDLTVRINSPGGDAFKGLSIYNALNRRSGRITVEVDALAASAASFIAMAGDQINIAENAMIMIHSAWTLAMGNASDLEGTVSVLRKMDSTIAQTYASRTDTDVAQVTDMMEEETWFTADEAVAAGFADSVGQELKVAVSWSDGLRFKHAPAALRARLTGISRRTNPDDAYLRQRKDYVNRLVAEVKIARQRAACG